ncbi:MAG: NAD(P)-binding protein [Anaeromyxobacter sp.]
MSDICILGTGMAGFGAAHALREAGKSALLFDKKAHIGGHTASYVYEGGRFTFDEGPHVSFTKDERVKKILADAVNGDYEGYATKVNNHWKGHWIKHPAQINLHGLPPELVSKIIVDYVEAKAKPPARIDNYEQWLRASFGNTFAETFPMEYTVKYHTTTAANMSTDWIGPRLYQAKLEEILKGALSPASADVHYIEGFRYPRRGGFVSYLKKFMDASQVKLGHGLKSIHPKAKEVRFENGAVVPYSQLISSVPLPDLVPTIEGAPKDVLDAAARLACTEAVIVNVVVDRADLIDAHWTYFYDRDFFFTRLSTPHLQSRNNVPPGCGSIQAECYYSRKYRPRDVTPEQCIEPVVRDLKRCGIIRETDKVMFTNAMHIEYANVIFDLERADALKTVHGFLADVGIAWCGRYGDWEYIWTDESFLSGERAARTVLAR